jgi:osmotically-inducible protein OsmY
VTTQQERSTGDALNDAEINARLDAALLSEEGQPFIGISTHVLEGRVTLMGAVVRETDKTRVEEIARSIPGVLSIKNVIETGGTRTRTQILTDTRVASTARLRLLSATDVASLNYSVTVINGTLHLNGLAQSEAELQRAVAAVNTINGVARVVSHVLLVDDPTRVVPQPRT